MASLKNKLGGLVAANWAKLWMSTLDHQITHYEADSDPVHEKFTGRAIFVSWHEYLLIPFYLRGWTQTALLTSHHRDAEWLSQAARHMGFQTVRGSTARGGSRALLEMVRTLDGMNIGIATDGPRGPRRQMAPGPIYLSSKLQIPIIAIGIGFDRPWRMPTWDAFALPRPFCRSRIIMGPRVQIPPDLNREELEHYRVSVQGLLNYLTTDAERWAASKERREHQRATFPQPVANRKSRGQGLGTVRETEVPGSPSVAAVHSNSHGPLADLPLPTPLRNAQELRVA